MTINVDLLEETMRAIECFPEDHEQSQWVTACGAQFCFAGHAAVRSHPKWYLEIDSDGLTTGRMLDATRTEDMGRISDIAREALGIGYNDADELFHASNQRWQLRVMVDRLKMRA